MSATEQKPLLYLDVDGVINVFNLGASLIQLEHEFWAEARGREFKIQVPEGVTERLGRLDEAYEVVWCTTWGELAPEQIGAPLGLPDWPVLEFKNLRMSPSGTWKIADILEHAGDRPLAFIDDQIFSDAAIRVGERLERGLPTLLVAADERAGLSEELFERLLSWADLLAEGRGAQAIEAGFEARVEGGPVRDFYLDDAESGPKGRLAELVVADEEES